MPNYRCADLPGATYFFTVNTRSRQPWLLNADVRAAFIRAIGQFAHSNLTRAAKMSDSKTVHECTLRVLCNRSSALILHLARGKLIGNGADRMTA